MNWYRMLLFLLCINFGAVIANSLGVFSESVIITPGDVVGIISVSAIIGIIIFAAASSLLSRGTITGAVVGIMSTVFWASYGILAVTVAQLIPALWMTVFTTIYGFIFVMGIMQVATGTGWQQHA